MAAAGFLSPGVRHMVKDHSDSTKYTKSNHTIRMINYLLKIYFANIGAQLIAV